jgi:hypothetical protein
MFDSQLVHSWRLYDGKAPIFNPSLRRYVPPVALWVHSCSSMRSDDEQAQSAQEHVSSAMETQLAAATERVMVLEKVPS